MNRSPLVYIVILNYNGYIDTIECINSIKRIIYDNYRVVIVDNNSNDDSEKILKEKFPDYIILQTGKNLGYAAGNNIGIKYAVTNNANYICIMNNDVIVNKFFLNKLINYMDDNRNTAMVGPMLLEYKNKDIIQSTGSIINLNKGYALPLNNNKRKNQIKEGIIKCDYVSGACILVRKEIIDVIGLIPENYFLFYEETEWCLKVKQYGYDVTCVCDAEIIHKGSISINKISGLNEYFMCRSRVVFEKRNANTIQFINFCLYLIIQTAYRIAFKKQSVITVKYYMDGFFDRVSREYDFAYIAEK